MLPLYCVELQIVLLDDICSKTGWSICSRGCTEHKKWRSSALAEELNIQGVGRSRQETDERIKNNYSNSQEWGAAVAECAHQKDPKSTAVKFDGNIQGQGQGQGHSQHLLHQPGDQAHHDSNDPPQPDLPSQPEHVRGRPVGQHPTAADPPRRPSAGAGLCRALTAESSGRLECASEPREDGSRMKR